MTFGSRFLLLLLAASTPVLTACAGESTLEIRPMESLSDESELAGLVLRLQGRELRADDFQAADGGVPRVELEVPNSGILTVRAELFQDDRLVASGVIGWEMREEYRWGLSVFRQADDPADACFGCMGSDGLTVDEAFRNEPGERLWFTWGGRPRGSDVVY